MPLKFLTITLAHTHRRSTTSTALQAQALLHHRNAAAAQRRLQRDAQEEEPLGVGIEEWRFGQRCGERCVVQTATRPNRVHLRAAGGAREQVQEHALSIRLRALESRARA